MRPWQFCVRRVATVDNATGCAPNHPPVRELQHGRSRATMADAAVTPWWRSGAFKRPQSLENSSLQQRPDSTTPLRFVCRADLGSYWTNRSGGMSSHGKRLLGGRGNCSGRSRQAPSAPLGFALASGSPPEHALKANERRASSTTLRRGISTSPKSARQPRSRSAARLRWFPRLGHWWWG